MKPKTKLRRTT